MMLTLGGVFLALPAKSARPLRANAVPGIRPAQPLTLLFNRSLKSTTQEIGTCCATVGSGFSNIDSALTFTCPGPGTCTVTDEMVVQAGNNTIGGNRWALVGLLDGNYIDGGPFVGELLTDSNYSVATWTSAAGSVAPGKHTLQSQIYTDDGATLANWGITYRLYKP